METECLQGKSVRIFFKNSDNFFSKINSVLVRFNIFIKSYNFFYIYEKNFYQKFQILPGTMAILPSQAINPGTGFCRGGRSGWNYGQLLPV